MSFALITAILTMAFALFGRSASGGEIVDCVEAPSPVAGSIGSSMSVSVGFQLDVYVVARRSRVRSCAGQSR